MIKKVLLPNPITEKPLTIKVKVRYFIFLRDVLWLSLMAFGGPQVHISMFLDLLVEKRNYLNEQELLELQALCQILPGPTSTQTITAIGFKVGGPKLAYLTLLVWALPAVIMMTAAGVSISYLQAQNISLSFTKYIQPMAVGFVAFAAYRISSKVITTNVGLVLMVVAAVAGFFIRSPWIFPFLLLVSGAITAIRYRKRHQWEPKEELKIEWANFLLYTGVLVGTAILGKITMALPIRLFENFYRNGSMIFGGGQVLIPLMYTEFVHFKEYLTSQEFLTGYAVAQTMPGPVFSFVSYIGALSMREYGIWGEILGGLVAATGIFLPGTFLIFFVIRFWARLKKYRVVKASLEGINAASSGLVMAAAILLFQPIENTPVNFSVIGGTFCLLLFTRIPSPVIILGGLVAGFIL
jgi:chromate transporter